MVENFTALYALVFYVSVIALAGCELLPLNRQIVHLARRWPTNVGLFALNFVIMRICVPISAVEVAQRAGSGPLSFLPTNAGIILGVLALDLWKYCEHRVMHQISLLWRFHLVHHSDTEIDFTTTERHHPIEVAFSSVVLLAVIYLLAVPPLAVVIFVLFGTVVTFASHANLRVPGQIDRTLRRVIVTPSVHVIHHSALRDETDSNYGPIFTVWDRLFGTYRERDDRETSVPVQGLEVFRAPGDARLDRVLWHPFSYRTTTRAVQSQVSLAARDDAPIEAAQQVRAEWLNALLGIGLGLIVLVLAFQSTAIELVSIWGASTTYGYAWLVIPALAYLLWHHRQRFLADRPSWSLVGIAASAACGVAWLFFDLLNVGVGRQFALVAAIPCLVLSAVGFRAFARLTPSLTLLALLVPSGDFLLPPLKALTLHIISAAAALAHLPHVSDGQVIFVAANRYVVVDDCAGLPYLLTTLFLGLTFGLLTYRSAWKIGLFALFGVVCGIVANGVRVVSIVMIDLVRGTPAELSSHIVFQWVAFACAVAVMVAVLMSASSEPGEPTGLTQTGRDEHASARCLFAALCAATLAVSIPRIALARIDPGNNPAVLREANAVDLLPESFAGWAKRTTVTSWNPAPRMPIPYALARYARGNQEMEVFVAAAEQPTHKVTGYAIDLVGPGQWLEAKRHPLSNCQFPRCGEVNVLELDLQLNKDVRHVYYVYALEGRIIGSALELQLQRAWNGLVGAPQRARIIAVASDGDVELRPGDIAEAINALASDKAHD